MGVVADTDRARPSRIYHTHSRTRAPLFRPTHPHEKRRTIRTQISVPQVLIVTTALFVTLFISQQNITPQHPYPRVAGSARATHPHVDEKHVPSVAEPVRHNVQTEPQPVSAVLQMNPDVSRAAKHHAPVHVESPSQHSESNTLPHVASDEQKQQVAYRTDMADDFHMQHNNQPLVSFRDPTNVSSFSPRTALNYFHLHKTGGVSFKERLFDFFMDDSRRNSRGRTPVVLDTCYESGPARPALGIEAKWSCDWGQMAKKTEAERNSIDVVLGHQYWEKGTEYWLPSRDLRYFTVMRHPLHRKISFFYHFFVRNAGRAEDDVTVDELIQFILGKSMPDSPLIRDAGPAYYASRLSSDGISGFSNTNRFVIENDNVDKTVSNSIQRLRHNFLFIGLQTQEKASLCMLKVMVKKFAIAQGFDNMHGLNAIAAPRKRMNTGSYALSGRLLWQKMSEQQREEYKFVERVDLAIYKESVSMFHEMTKRFECSHFVDNEDADDNIAL